MENASKALLIAGAVLIVILIIGVGMAIYSGAQGSINSAISQMSAQEQQIFNAQFSSYEGSQKGTKVKTLINTVISSNAQADSAGTPTVTINGDSTEASLVAYRATITESSTYTVTLTTTNGVITEITIA